jgi:hypothetical protein
LTACGTDTSSSTGTGTQSTGTVNGGTPAPTIDQAAPTATFNQAQPTPDPTIDQAQPTPDPTIDQATPTQAPQPTVSPSSLKPNNCTATSTGWDCSLSLSDPYQQQVDWTVANSDLPTNDISYSPPSGTLSASNQYQQTVTISIASRVCQNGNSTSGTFVFSFTSRGQTSITWSCR